MSEFARLNKVTSNENNYKSEFDELGRGRLSTSQPILLGVLESYSGSIFDNGVFKIHSFGSMFFWDKTIGKLFPDYSKSISFGMDWTGRVYSVSLDNKMIYQFDPADWQVYEMEQSLIGFLNSDLVEYREDTLGVSLFDSFNTPLKFSDSLGFKKPLFLGGKDVPNNYELIDTEVYWDITHQLFQKARRLPDGTSIGDVRIK